jgi:hypothetical protein
MCGQRCSENTEHWRSNYLSIVDKQHDDCMKEKILTHREDLTPQSQAYCASKHVTTELTSFDAEAWIYEIFY